MQKNLVHSRPARSGAWSDIKIPAFVLGVLAGAVSAQASTDYAPAKWVSAPPGYWYTSGHGHHFCVIHDMEGYYHSTVSFLSKPNSRSVSVHYCVNSKKDTSTDDPQGEITQMVREAYWAWHARCWNQWMFGTEHEGFVSNPAWYTETMYVNSAALQKHMPPKAVRLWIAIILSVITSI